MCCQQASLLCSSCPQYFAFINSKPLYLLLEIPENMAKKDGLPALSKQASRCCRRFTRCRQFEFRLAGCLRLAAVFQPRDLAEESVKKNSTFCKQVLLTFFFFFLALFSENFEVACYVVKIPEDQQSAPTAPFNIAESPTSPFWSSFPLSCPLQGPTRANRLPPSKSILCIHIWPRQFQPRQRSTITFTYRAARSHIQRGKFTASARQNAASCFLRKQAAWWCLSFNVKL